MDVAAKLIADVVRISLGAAGFSWLAWAYVSVLVLAVGPMFCQVAPRLVDPPARLIATEPATVARWLAYAPLLAFALVFALLVTIFAWVLIPILAILCALAGYVAIGRLAGERLVHLVAEVECPPWLAALVGLSALRILRLVPLVGGAAHTFVLWVGFAAAACTAQRAAWSWHRRRMPDAEQFRGETLIEWYPDGDPADGRPSTGTGRPVRENIRGDEDRGRGDRDGSS